MLTYIIRRVLLMIPVLWGIATVVFLLMFVFVPGDPARVLLGQHGDERTLELIKQKYGLDQPLYIQYGRFMANLAKGDLGYSYRKKRPVTEIIGKRLPATIKLAVVSMVLATILGVVLGILAATRQNSFTDGVIMMFSLFGISTPVFWLGLMFILFFASYLGWLPTYGYGRGGDIQHLILPALSLSILSVGAIARYTRSSMLEVIRQDYIRTARAKGLSFWRVVYKHALKNAMIPVITVVGMNFAGLLGGAVATEYVFSWPGIGKLLVDSIRVRDVPVVEGGVILLGVSFLVINLLVDISYAFFNPRIRYE